MACLIELGPLEWRSAQRALPDVEGDGRTYGVAAPDLQNMATKDVPSNQNQRRLCSKMPSWPNPGMNNEMGLDPFELDY